MKIKTKYKLGIETFKIKGFKTPWFLGIGLHYDYGEYYIVINLLKIQLKIGWIIDSEKSILEVDE